MKIAITGAEGQIGSRLIRMGCEPLSCDVTDRNQVASELHRVEPDIVIHLAAMTSVDWCEQNYEEACSVNVFGTNIVCEEAEKAIGSGKVALISSDMVFDGKKGFYSEEDEPNPINNYGLTKLAAEGIAQLYGDKIIRISRCFDSNSADIKKYIDGIKNGESVFVPEHMTRSFAHIDFIADRFYQYSQNFERMPEILHVCSTASVSFFDLICEITRELGLSAGNVFPRGEEPGHTPRPFGAGLNPVQSFRLGFSPITLHESVLRYVNENS